MQSFNNVSKKVRQIAELASEMPTQTGLILSERTAIDYLQM